jgi:nucleoside-diphosphate-sugar epimerase
MFNNQKVLVTGGAGMIGRQLVKKLVLKGAKVTIADLTEPEHLPFNVDFVKTDLRNFNSCLEVCKGTRLCFPFSGCQGVSTDVYESTS